jgi:hypothetical protein
MKNIDLNKKARGNFGPSEVRATSGATSVLLNGSSLDDCGRLDDCLDKTSRNLVFFLLKSRTSHHEHSFPSLQPLAAYRTIAE